MLNDVPIASLLRVERGVAAPEELAAVAVVVACCARRTAGAGQEPAAAGPKPGHRRRAPSPAGCWAGCWACR